ncbi:MAG: TauD/TfdA family dioxygenase, partial [Myxococcota bacterium]
MQNPPQILETQCEWRATDVADSSEWIEILDESDCEEIHAALQQALSHSNEILDIERQDFPLPNLSDRLRGIEDELINGRGFVLLRGLPRDKYTQPEMEMIYWGVGMHLGQPWPQNKHGHVLGDVTDQGKRGDDPTSRGNEIGRVAFPYHSDGSDLVGLMCLQKARRGGLSTVANAVAIHNDLVRDEPELAAALYALQPYDFRGEEAPGDRGWYEIPVFTEWSNKLFVRYIRPYILSSQRHANAPRIDKQAETAMQRVDAMTQDESYNVYMDLEPGDIQFINNYHVLHARTAYEDDHETGQVRHLKRLWLATETLEERPPYFQ